MGTHPIFESDFDCLTEVKFCNVKIDELKIKKRKNMGRSYSRTPPRRRRSSSHDRRRKRRRSRSRSRGRRDRHSRSRERYGGRSAPKSKTLAIFNVSNRCEEDDLYRMFDRFGRLERVKIVCDRKRGAQCGFAFITFEDQRDADDAKDECHGKDLDGRALRVDYSLTRKEHSPTPGVYKGQSSSRRSNSRGRRSYSGSPPSYGRRRRSPSYGNHRSRS